MVYILNIETKIMKKLLIITFIILLFNGTISFASVTDDIRAIESNIFGYEYSNESDSKRIERIEKHLYGEKRSGSVKQRLENIQNDAGYVVVEKKQPDKVEITATPTNKQQQQPQQMQQQMQQQTAEQNKQRREMTALKEDASVEYPMVDKLEQAIFSTTYKKDDIYTRLDRLEQKVFNKVSNQDLNTRVDRLASIVNPTKTKTRDNYNYTSQDMDKYYANSGLEPVNNQSLPFQLSALEQDILRSNYMNDNISSRLTRLEQKLFKRTFPTDSDITRLQRIMVAYDAKQNSSRYDNNRAMQNMATASQLGGLLLMILAILL